MSRIEQAAKRRTSEYRLERLLGLPPMCFHRQSRNSAIGTRTCRSNYSTAISVQSHDTAAGVEVHRGDLTNLESLRTYSLFEAISGR